MSIKAIRKREFSAYVFRKLLPAWIVGTIVDLETRSLDSAARKLTGVGIVKENKLQAYVLKKENWKGSFQEWARKKIRKCPRPYISYNKEFEESWLDIDFDIDIQPVKMIPKSKAVSFYHIRNTPNYAMITATAREIMYHLVCDLLEEVSLYISLSHLHRTKKFRVSYIEENFPDNEEF